MPRGTVLRSSLRLKTSENAVVKSMDVSNNAMKRKASDVAASKSKTVKRSAFGDITNAVNDKNKSNNLKDQVKKGLTNIRSSFGSKKSSVSVKKITAVIERKESFSPIEDDDSDLTLSQESLPTSSQEDFKSVILEEDDNFVSALEDVDSRNIFAVETPRPKFPDGVIDFDKENWEDPNQCSAYAADIFEYYRSREAMFAVEDYIAGGRHPEVTETMRSILVDWLVEVQESFELNHETLYTAVKIFDSYLSLETQPVKKDELQLIGATACLIACKIDERLPPLLDDFVYVCDDAYTREQIIRMERKIIRTVDYDVGYPLSYRFLRRYGRVCKVTMPVLTLARYILETTLMEYSFNIVGISESKLAAATLILAFKIHGIQGWASTLKYYSGYSPAKDLSELVQKLFKLISKPNSANLKTIKQKYSHVVFHEVALIQLPKEVKVAEE